jgi:hypothetical protein
MGDGSFWIIWLFFDIFQFFRLEFHHTKQDKGQQGAIWCDEILT